MKEFEVINCECGHTCPMEFALMNPDGDGWICPNCIHDQLISNLLPFKTIVSKDRKKDLEFAHPINVDNHYEWGYTNVPLLMDKKTEIKNLKILYPNLNMRKIELIEILITIPKLHGTIIQP